MTEQSSAHTVPDVVRHNVQRALSLLRTEETALDAIDRARGSFILSLELRDRMPDIAKAIATLNEFRELAPANGVDAEAFILGLGGAPDFGRFGKPAATSVTATGGLQPRDEEQCAA